MLFFGDAARLENSVLCFPRLKEGTTDGVASYRVKSGNKLWGVVFEISDDDLEALDRSEGFKPGRAAQNNSYNRLTVNIVLYPEGKTKAFTYLAIEQGEYFRTADDYLERILVGAESLTPEGLPGDYIEQVKKSPSLNKKTGTRAPAF